MSPPHHSRVQQLLARGVTIPTPQAVEIGEEVDLDRISAPGVVLHTGSRIFGDRTLILRGARLGYEGPVTVENCQVGPEVDLKGGFFREAVFLKKAALGLGAHVRQGTLMEEQAGGAHTVALKQAILFPFVTLGSLINFCDGLMAGGTSRKNHSEMGSSYIHFNYTPGQDKATASLLGDVPRGVMLNQAPIFLGGQGGLVGPCRIAYGTVIAAGTVWRKDELRPGQLLFGGSRKAGSIPYRPGALRSDKRIVTNNLVYIANLAALVQWYGQVRAIFVGEDFPETLLVAAKRLLHGAIAERVGRLGDLCRGSSGPAAADSGAGEAKVRGNALQRHWPEVEALLLESPRVEGETGVRDLFLSGAETARQRSGKDYIDAVRGFSPETAAAGTRWLQGIVDRVVEGALARLPGFGV